MRDDTTYSYIGTQGAKTWENADGERHREDGPALIFTDGTQWWYQNGLLHREDGPAQIWVDGVEHWYFNGELHRDGGPASIYNSPATPKQQEQWFQRGLLHREDGPASTYPYGIEEWYINGKKINYEFTSLQDLIDKHPEELI